MKSIIVLSLGLFLTTNLYSSEILNCFQVGESNIGYNPSSKKFEAEAKINNNKKHKITFVVNEDHALLKGNAGNGVK
ncbi:MAG: hypothetical protein HN730_00665 [Bdellovibrionales bacterium]|jgi:hypothetical protein|nr:hypothetical protein [Bdellovibrionales bacterium]